MGYDLHKESVWLLDGGWIGAGGKGRQESGRKLSLDTDAELGTGWVLWRWERVNGTELGS